MTCHHVADHRRIIFLVSPKSFASSRGVLGENISSRSLGNNSSNFRAQQYMQRVKKYLYLFREKSYLYGPLKPRLHHKCSCEYHWDDLVYFVPTIFFCLMMSSYWLKMLQNPCLVRSLREYHPHWLWALHVIFGSDDRTRTSAMINKSWKGEYLFVRFKSKISSDKWPDSSAASVTRSPRESPATISLRIGKL